MREWLTRRFAVRRVSSAAGPCSSTCEAQKTRNKKPENRQPTPRSLVFLFLVSCFLFLVSCLDNHIPGLAAALLGQDNVAVAAFGDEVVDHHDVPGGGVGDHGGPIVGRFLPRPDRA